MKKNNREEEKTAPEKPENWLQAELIRAYKEARKNKRKTLDEQHFERNAGVYLAELFEEIENRTYEPSRSIAFIINKPVIREIFAAPFRDRVIHHLLFNAVNDWWDRQFIHDNYSCRKGKGALFGVQRLDHHIRSESRNYSKKCYVLKLDIQGYFMSLPRKALFDVVDKGLRQQFVDNKGMYSMYRFLWGKIIFDDPTIGAKIRGTKEDWASLPKTKSLFHAKPGCGIVIGNLTSQLLSNIYLNLLDQFVLHDLCLPHYGRYVDDFYIISKDKNALIEAKEMTSEFLAGLGLVLHPKKMLLQEISHGVPFLGAVVYPHRIQVGRRCKAQVREAVRRYRLADNDLDLAISVSEAISLTSYYGLTKHYAHKKMWKKYFETDFSRTDKKALNY